MNKYLNSLFLTLDVWCRSAQKEPNHLLRHSAREDANEENPKRRLFRWSRRDTFQTVTECLLGYNNREHGCIGTPQANKLVLGIGTKKIHDDTKVHLRTIQRRRKELRERGWIEIEEKAKRDPKGRFTFIPAVEKFTDKAYETIGFIRDPDVYHQQQQAKNRKYSEKRKPLVKGYADEAWKFLQKKFGDALNKNAAVMQELLTQLNFGKQMTMDALSSLVESLLTTGPPPDPIPA